MSSSSAASPFSNDDTVNVAFQFDGTDGAKGEKGQDGASVKGQKGAAGADGTSVKGQKGVAGTNGDDGAKGIKGQDGASVKGQKGQDGASVKGQKGQDGAKGIKGERGEKGIAGTNAANIYPYTFKTDTSGDMGSGELRGNQSTQNTSTRIKLNSTDGNNTTIPTPTAPGSVTLREVETESNFLIFAFSTVTVDADQIELEGSISASSASNPFDGEDSITASFVFDGSDGAKGQKGQAGADGASVKGQKGQDGASVKGQKGQDGASVKGQKGQAGAAGTAATVDVGTTETLAAGEPATVNNSGSTESATFDFGIPQGITGAKGQDGASVKGQKGQDGASVKGQKGAAGTNGDDGAKGQKGAESSASVTGSGSATRVAFWSGTQALSSNSNLYWDNTNDILGLGGTGTFTSSHSLNIDGTGLAIKNNVNGSNNNWSTITNTDTGSGSNLVFTSGQGVALTLNNNKNAEFSGDVRVVDRLLINAAASTGSPYLSLDQDGVEKAYIQYVDAGDNLVMQSDGVMNFRTGATSRLSISNAGDSTFTGQITASKNQNATSSFSFQNLDTTGTGVRTHLNAIAGNRSIRLEAIHNDHSYLVSGNSTMYLQTSGGSNNTVLLQDKNATFAGDLILPAQTIQFGSNSNHILSFESLDSTTTAMELQMVSVQGNAIGKIYAEGTVGDGNNLLAFRNGNGNNFMASTQGGSTVFSTSNTERIRITSAGPVGINNTSPGTVNGTAFGGVMLHITGSGNIGRLVLEGAVQGTMLMNATGSTANQRLKFIQSKQNEFRMGKVSDSGTETTQFSIDDSGDCEIETNGGALILRDSSGTRYAVTVDGGTLEVNQL